MRAYECVCVRASEGGWVGGSGSSFHCHEICVFASSCLYSFSLYFILVYCPRYVQGQLGVVGCGLTLVVCGHDCGWAMGSVH